MKLLVLADLHLDAYTDIDATRALAEAIRETGRQADGLVIAGDLAESASRTWPHALRWLGRLYPPERTVLLPGNHDYHGENIDRLDTRLARICAQAGCGFAQGRVLACGDIRLLAATLWTDLRLFQSRGEEAVAESLRQARQGMPDYVPGRIMTGRPERGLRPEDSAAIHRTQKAWLTAELAQPWPGRTVVVTHHCPSPELSGPVSPLSPCFASDLDDLIDRFRPAAWLFGHTYPPAGRGPGSGRHAAAQCLARLRA